MTAKILVYDDETDLGENGRFSALAQPTADLALGRLGRVRVAEDEPGVVLNLETGFGRGLRWGRIAATN
jgi:hypothetical protein